MTPTFLRELAADYLFERETQGNLSEHERRGVNGFVDYLINLDAIEDFVLGDSGLPYTTDWPQPETKDHCYG